MKVRRISPVVLWRDLRSTTPRGRMMRGVLSNVYDKCSITLVQLLSIPVMTHAWGAEGYGLWLMLMTVPTYIALSDFGFGTAAGAALTASVAQKDYSEGLRVFQSTIAFIGGVVSLVALLVISGAICYGLSGSEGTAGLSAGDLAKAVVLVTIYAVIVSLMSVVNIAYRATHAFAWSMTFYGTMILIEGAVMVTLVLSGQEIFVVLAIMAIMRSCSFGLFVICLKRREPWVGFGLRHADRTTVARLARPSLAALAQTMAGALMLQGMVTALGAASGPAVVAAFGPARTLSRIPLQFSGLFLRPSIPELTHAITAGDHKLEGQLNRLNLGMALLATAPFGLMLCFAGPWLLGWISHGNLSAPTMLFLFLSLAAVMFAIWNAQAAGLIAMNLQAGYAWLYLVLSAAVVIVTFLSADMITAAIAQTFAEAIMVAQLIWLRRQRSKT